MNYKHPPHEKRHINKKRNEQTKMYYLSDTVLFIFVYVCFCVERDRLNSWKT